MPPKQNFFPTQGCPLDSGVEQNPKVPGHFGIFGKISPNSRAIFGVCFYSAQKAGGFCARAKTQHATSAEEKGAKLRKGLYYG